MAVRANQLKEMYSCSCGKMFPLNELYYCVGCNGIKCLYCVNEEIVSYYCLHCLDNVSSTEVIPSRGRCNKCFICPECQSSAKVVSQGQACYLRCVYCSWDSKAFAIAPTPANLFQLLREQERGGQNAVLFKERLTEYGKMCEEMGLLRMKQESKARTKKTQSLLIGTPAKSKYFAFSSSSPAQSSKEEDEAAAANARNEDDTEPNRMTDSLARLEAEQEAKNASLFLRPSTLLEDGSKTSQGEGEIQKGVDGCNDGNSNSKDGEEDEEEGDDEVVVERQVLLSGTSKHCNTCDKLLVKCDVNPHNALDAKNRIHVAAMFVLTVGLVSMSPKAGTVKLFLANPMKNPVEGTLSPLNDRCRYTIASTEDVKLGAAQSSLPLEQNLVCKVLKNEANSSSEVRFGVKVSIKYQGILGAQSVEYTVLVI